MRFELEFEETFAGDALETSRWLPFYLPHWSSRSRAAARYAIADGALRLLIEEDQEPWCPELDDEVRVSSLQTGAFSGPVGSTTGQHRFHPAAVVREEQPSVRLYTPQYGRIEMRARFPDDPRSMGALWLIGYEDEPERSAEICVCEIFGRDVTSDGTVVGVGVHPFGDPRIADDFARVSVPLDAREPHTYAAEWTPSAVAFLVDGETVRTVSQSPGYPMQLMLGLYELDRDGGDGHYPLELVVDYVRGYRPAAPVRDRHRDRQHLGERDSRAGRDGRDAEARARSASSRDRRGDAAARRRRILSRCSPTSPASSPSPRS